ncbi:hypothetical protein ACIHCN_39270, partial [Streptomyces rishiriensis]
MRSFETGQTVVRRDVHRCGGVWTEHALRVVADTNEKSDEDLGFWPCRVSGRARLVMWRWVSGSARV